MMSLKSFWVTPRIENWVFCPAGESGDRDADVLDVLFAFLRGDHDVLEYLRSGRQCQRGSAQGAEPARGRSMNLCHCNPLQNSVHARHGDSLPASSASLR